MGTPHLNRGAVCGATSACLQPETELADDFYSEASKTHGAGRPWSAQHGAPPRCLHRLSEQEAIAYSLAEGGYLGDLQPNPL